MDTRKQNAVRQIDDLPVQADQAGAVKGGVVPDAPELIAHDISIRPGEVKGFNRQPDPPKVAR